MRPVLTILAIFALGLAAGIGIGQWQGIGTPQKRQAVAPVTPPPGSVRKRVGLVAHDACKGELLAWVEKNAGILAAQELFSTGTTGRLVLEKLARVLPDTTVNLTRFNSGPLGGDQQMGALVAQGGLDILVFFVDPLSAHPHDADVKALLRLCGVHNTVLAITPSTADFVIDSPHFTGQYVTRKPDYSSYVNRPVR